MNNEIQPIASHAKTSLAEARDGLIKAQAIFQVLKHIQATDNAEQFNDIALVEIGYALTRSLAERASKAFDRFGEVSHV